MGGECDILEPLDEALASPLAIAARVGVTPLWLQVTEVGESSISDDEPVAARAKDVTELEILCNAVDLG